VDTLTNPKLKILIALGICLVLAGLSACTIDQGSPWGKVSTTAEMSLDDTESALSIESVELSATALQLTRTTSSSGSSGEFSPSNPPSGCNLCHNGHCHCDGELVSYEELRNRSSGGTSTEVIVGYDAFELSDGEAADLGTVGISKQTSAERLLLRVESLQMNGTFEPEDGEAVDVVVSPPGIGGTTLSTASTLGFGADKSFRRQLDVEIQFPAKLTEEGLDVSNLERRADGSILLSSTSNRQTAESIKEHLKQQISLNLSVEIKE
jgi:hypothetical protein